MGLFNLGGTVLTTYKADTSDMKRKIKDLRGEERKAAKERLEEVEKQNSKLEGQIATLGKVGLAVGTVAAAYVAAKESFAEYTKRAQLESAAAGVNIDALKSKSRGLLSEMKLLELAAQAQNSAFGATQDELNTVAEAYTLLVSKGYEGERVFEALKKAAVEANTEGLKEFGIQIKTQSDTLKGHNDLIAGLRENISKAGGAYSIAGESMQRATVAMDDSFSQLKSSVGELAQELAPAISALASLISLMARGVGPIADFFAVSSAERNRIKGFQEAGARLPGESDVDYVLRMQGGGNGRSAMWATFANTLQASPALRALNATQSAAMEGARVGGIADQVTREQLAYMKQIATATAISAKVAAGRRGGSINLKGLPSGIPGMAGDQGSDPDGLEQLMDYAIGQGSELDAALQQLRELQEEFGQKGEPTLLQRVFGDIDEMAPIIESGLAVISGSLKGAYSAWATGALSAGEAVKKALAETIAGIGNEMFVRSLAAFASGNFASGSLYAAGAVTAGVIARQMNASARVHGGGEARTGGGSLGPAFAGAAGDSGGRNVTVYLGSDFSTGDRRQQQQRLRRSLNDIGMGTDGQVVFA